MDCGLCSVAILLTTETPYWRGKHGRGEPEKPRKLSKPPRLGELRKPQDSRCASTNAREVISNYGRGETSEDQPGSWGGSFRGSVFLSCCPWNSGWDGLPSGLLLLSHPAPVSKPSPNPVTNPSMLTGSLNWLWMESFLWSVFSNLSGLSRHLSVHLSPEKAVRRENVWAAAEGESGGVFMRYKERYP